MTTEPNANKPRAGEVWQVTHTRKGSFAAKFLNDVDMAQDPGGFMDVMVAGGRARFMSGDAGEGDVITIRKSMTTLNWRVDPEQA
jgi:hypothetical protein